MELTCPKCQGSMRSYERNGVVVDQCVGCSGIFLDRGELEALLDAEASYYGGEDRPLPAAPGSAAHPAPPLPQPPALRVVPAPSDTPSWDDGDDAYVAGVTFDARYDPAYHRREADRGQRRRGSFLQQLFE